MLFLILIIFIVGCEREYSISPQPMLEHSQSLMKEINNQFEFIPIEVEQGDFYQASGFLNDHTLLYMTEHSMGTNLFSYDFEKGEKKLLLESGHPIVSVTISPSRELILVHSSPTSNIGLVHIINQEGERLLSEEIPSTELTLAWNPFEENSILLSAFTENWDFTVYEMNLETQAFKEIDVPQPFAYWLNESQLLYLDWDGSPSLVTSLKVYDKDTNQDEFFLSNIYHVDSFGDYFMTISVDGADEENAVYSLYSNTFEEVFTFITPHLSLFSGWLVPYYDYIAKSNVFLIFLPLFSSEADIYQAGFQLVSYDMDTGEKAVLLENMRNEPISCSPNGNYCLLGHYFEKILSVETKEVVSLVGKNERN